MITKEGTEKTFSASAIVTSRTGKDLPLWNTNTNSFVFALMTQNNFTIQAKDKTSARKQIFKLVRAIQTKVNLRKAFSTIGNADFYIRQINQL